VKRLGARRKEKETDIVFVLNHLILNIQALRSSLSLQYAL